MIELDVPDGADDLVEALPDAGLTGTAIDKDTVRILNTHGSDPDDVIDELMSYANRFGIHGARIISTGIRDT